MTEIKNARINATMLGIEDHGIFTAYLTLDYGGSGQSFGGWSLCTPQPNSKPVKRIGTAFGADFIMEVLRVVGVNSWEDLIGSYVRVKAEHTKVHSIGHITEDKWFYPEVLVDGHPKLSGTSP